MTKDIGIVDSIVELKFLVNQLSNFSIVQPNKQDLDILKSIVEIVDVMHIPEIVGVVDGKEKKEYN